jgi:hypothetical protein
MRTTVRIQEPLLENSKLRAAERGITLSALVEDALRVHLAADSRPPAPPFRLHTVRGKLVDPRLDLSRTSALIAREDEPTYGKTRS